MFYNFLLIVLLGCATASAKEVCYGDAGCFNDGAPFRHLSLPKDPYNQIPPTYYSHRQGKNVETLKDASQLQATDVFFLVHGFGEYYGSSWDLWARDMTNKLFSVKPNAQVIFMDWSKGAQPGQDWSIYYQAASNTRSIGGALGAFVASNAAADVSSYHCIGWSLGAQVCGFSGKRMKQINGKRWSRISALDPASPAFSNMQDDTARVAKGDADFVDVTHTSTLGLYFAVGDSDFWVNDVKQQPGCYDDAGLGDFMVQFFSCSHTRAPLIFTESISPPAEDPNCHLFCPCDSWTAFQWNKCNKCDPAVGAKLGYLSNLTSNRGEFYGNTKGQKPYCKA